MSSNKESMIKKYGSYEAYVQHLKRAGQRGGQAKVSKGPNKFKSEALNAAK